MGERVMGKTSLLNVVVEWARQEKQLVVLQLPHVNSRDAFAEEILDGMAAEAGTSLHRLGLRDTQGQLRLSTVVEFARVAGELSAGATSRSFLLCLEELDSMLVKCPDDATANQILDFILHVVTKTSLPIKFVFTMTRTAPQILRSDASPFMSAARIASLAPWTFEESHAFVAWLLGGAVTLDEDAHELLFAAGGGHPYLTKAVLQTLQELETHRAHGASITVEHIRSAIAASVASPELDFTLDNIVKVHFSDEEVQVLRRAATGSGGLSVAELRALPGSWPSVAHELQRRRYLRADDPGGYAQAFGLLAEWLKSKPWMDAPRPPVLPRSATVARAEGVQGMPPLLIDDTRKRVFLGTSEILLTPQEYRFLSCLLEHAGSVVDRSTVATQVWPDEVLLDGVREGRLDALVYRLRDELGSDATKYIETRRGRGFYLNPELVRRVPEMTS